MYPGSGVQVGVPGPGTASSYTPWVHIAHHRQRLHGRRVTGDSNGGKRDACQRPAHSLCPGPPRGITLPSLVTVLRSFSTGKNVEEGAESGEVWIAPG